ncbi:hypothetical protein KFU94_54135 [Chloroflexi bacterium TSY]|nr:hypothetical protein [Chloroflexi bacterium TSY]
MNGLLGQAQLRVLAATQNAQSGILILVSILGFSRAGLFGRALRWLRGR